MILTGKLTFEGKETLNCDIRFLCYNSICEHHSYNLKFKLWLMKENIKLARILLTDFDTFSDFQIEKVTTHYSKKKKKKNIES